MKNNSGTKKTGALITNVERLFTKTGLIRTAIVFLLICALIAGCSSPGSSSNQSMDYDSYREEDSGVSDESYNGIAGGESYEMEDGMEQYAQDPDAEIQKKSLSAQAVDSSQGQDITGPDGTQAGQADQTQQTDQTEAAQTTQDKKKKEEKLVYTCDLTIETTTYKKTMEEIEKQIKEFSGIIESQNEYDNDSGWYINGHTKTSGTMECTIVVRIPSKDYQAFLKALDGKGKMTHKSMDVTNISRTYYDTSAAIESLKIQEKRLLKMMDEAKTIEDMIRVEDRLTEVQTELNQYKTRLEIMDTQVAYSTVTMNIREVLEYKQTQEGKKTNTFSQRLQNTLEESWSGFLSFMEGLLFLCIRLFPFAVVVALVLFITRPLRLRYKEHRARKREEKNRMKSQKAGKEKKGFPFGKKKQEKVTGAENSEEDSGRRPEERPEIRQEEKSEEKQEERPEEISEGNPDKKLEETTAGEEATVTDSVTEKTPEAEDK